MEAVRTITTLLGKVVYGPRRRRCTFEGLDLYIAAKKASWWAAHSYEEPSVHTSDSRLHDTPLVLLSRYSAPMKCDGKLFSACMQLYLEKSFNQRRRQYGRSTALERNRKWGFVNAGGRFPFGPPLLLAADGLHSGRLAKT